MFMHTYVPEYYLITATSMFQLDLMVCINVLITLQHLFGATVDNAVSRRTAKRLLRLQDLLKKFPFYGLVANEFASGYKYNGDHHQTLHTHTRTHVLTHLHARTPTHTHTYLHAHTHNNNNTQTHTH